MKVIKRETQPFRITKKNNKKLWSTTKNGRFGESMKTQWLRMGLSCAVK